MTKEPEWEMTAVLFPKATIDGKRRNGPLMRRKVNGRYEYRTMTPEEQENWVSADAW